MNFDNPLTTEERIERALSDIERAKPAADLTQRIIAGLPATAPAARLNPWLGLMTLLAAGIGFTLAYQTASTLSSNGAFELVSYYTAQPEIVTMYPSEAWRALAAAVPWMTLGVAFVMLAVAFGLTYRWTGRVVARVTG